MHIGGSGVSVCVCVCCSLSVFWLLLVCVAVLINTMLKLFEINAVEQANFDIANSGMSNSCEILLNPFNTSDDYSRRQKHALNT